MPERSIEKSKLGVGAVVSTRNDDSSVDFYGAVPLTEGATYTLFISKKLEEASKVLGIPLSEITERYDNGQKITWHIDN